MAKAGGALGQRPAEVESSAGELRCDGEQGLGLQESGPEKSGWGMDHGAPGPLDEGRAEAGCWATKGRLREGQCWTARSTHEPQRDLFIQDRGIQKQPGNKELDSPRHVMGFQVDFLQQFKSI